MKGMADLDPNQDMRPSRRKKIKRAKRKAVGYDPDAPQMCVNCKFFRESYKHKPTGEFFPARCEKHLFQVNRHAVCDHWEDKR